MSEMPSIDDLKAAQKRIEPHIHRTPVMTSRLVDERARASVFCKCENLQRVGAFKIRGATNAVMSLDDATVSRGVATHSSGNHGAALSLAASMRGATAYIVMPESASQVKFAAVGSYGGRIIRCSADPADRGRTLDGVIADTGACLVHPFDDHRIIAGQGTVALELLEQVPDLDMVLVPVGGGGLISGVALAAHHSGSAASVIGVEPQGVDDALRSFRAGRIIPVPGGRSIADGLLTTVGEKTFPIISRFVDDIVTVSEAEIVDAMRFAWTRMKLVIEPSAAVPLAALFAGRVDSAGRRVGVILSGGNVDLDRLPWS
ncbi:MAG TPA: pyridoxal-phosphate dependent enzyme [Arenicellales bacterium]|nr:pyridoxal-phosphate dependent enzyme [Arenicellales bacterium]